MTPRPESWRPLCAIVIAAALWASTALAEAAVLVIDDGTGEVLEAEDATQPRYPASLAKVMTAYLVLEALAGGRLELDQKVAVSKHAAGQPPSKLGLGEGKKATVRLLLDAMLVRSANDAAVVLAEAVGGSEAAFAAAMTRKARALGMTATVFRNASGLPDKAQVTTARDMAILARALIAGFPDRFGLFGQQELTLGKSTRSTTNGWLKGYPGAEGIKTGFTCASGYNLLSSAKRDGRRLIAVILGAKTAGARNDRMTKLLDRSFAKGHAGGDAALRLDQLPSGPGGRPPYVLPAGKCAGTAVIGGGHLPGWGVVFGAFTSKAKASQAIKRNRKALKSVARSGRPAIIPKTGGSPRRYSALLVGLNRVDAGEACQRMRTLGFYCLALAPKQLNNPKAVWR